MDSNMLTLKWESHNDSYLRILSSIRQTSSFSDATIACDGRFYNVHKLVMSSCSDYLKTVFENVDVSGTQMAHPVIILHGVMHHHMEALLDYMYLGKVNILQTELTSVVKAAEILQIKGLAIPDNCNISGSNENKRRGEGNKITDIKRHRKDSVEEKKFKNITNRYEKVKDEQDSFKVKYQIRSFKSDVENHCEEKEASSPTKTTTTDENFSSDYSDNTSVKNELQDKKKKESRESKGYINESISHLEDHSLLSEQEKSSSSKYHELEINYDSTEPHCSNVDSEIQCDQNKDNKTPSKHDVGESSHSPGGPIEAIDLWLQLTSNNGHIDGVKCPICSKHCCNKGVFLTHYKTHTGDKPYACPHCPRRFVQRLSQLNHIKTHTCARKFACSLCTRRFIQKKNLKNHIASHSRKKVLMYKEMGNL